jgi:nitrate/TMAO reductase-like tetraheme cytochrome c subunit
MNHLKYLVLATAVLTGATIVAVADDEYDGHHYSVSHPAWKAECGSCHIAYPPQMLPASSWCAVMSGLDKHFGTDASLDSQTAASITAFLETNAGREHAPPAQPVLRISETRWFAREHDEVPAHIWRSATVNSPSNCAACHVDAEQGDFSENGIRIPK